MKLGKFHTRRFVTVEFVHEYTGVWRWILRIAVWRGFVWFEAFNTETGENGCLAWRDEKKWLFLGDHIENADDAPANAPAEAAYA